MKAFDYDKAKAGAEICTKDGNSVRVVCWDKSGKGKKQIVALIMIEGAEKLLLYKKDGTPESTQEDGMRLMMKPVLKEGWVVIPSEQGDDTIAIDEGVIYTDYNVALAAKDDGFKIGHVTWEE